MTTKKSVGRPRAELDLKLRIFEKGVVEGLSIGKALEAAKIPERTYYDYLDANPEYSQRVEKMREGLAEIAEAAIVKNIQIEPESAEHRREIIELAKWLLKKRKASVYGEGAGMQSGAPQLVPGGSGQLNINLGHQTVIRADDLSDSELERLRLGEDPNKVLGGRVIANAEKISK